MLVPTGLRATCISPFASAPVISPLPSSSPFPLSSPLPFSSPLLLSSPLFFFPLPLPPLPLPLVVTVSSLLSPGWVVVDDSTRIQVSILDEVVPGAKLETVDMCVSEVSRLLVLSVVMELLEAAKVDARRVGASSLTGEELSPEELLNHELPKENKRGVAALDAFDPSSVCFMATSSSPACLLGPWVPSSSPVPAK